MKIIDARTGKLQQIPLSLGESGRGRWLEEVKISNRPGQVPGGPEDIGFFVFGQDRKHVILTSANPTQQGILLRIDTRGCYTRGTVGKVFLKGGKATLLTAGQYAFGDAGRIGDGTDELWQVEEAAIFVVFLSGGDYKGYGHRYLVVTKSFRTLMVTRAELCQLIAAGADPEVAETVRAFAGVLHADVQQALAAATQLEQALTQPAPAVARRSNGLDYVPA